MDYEKSRDIPFGWINTSISASGRHGAWQKLERGEIPLDAAFFKQFKADLSNEKRWRQYYARSLAKTRKEPLSQGAEEAAFQVPAVPDIDAEWLYWEMMRISREPDPHMWPALQKLREAADRSNGKLIIGALSNTSIFPDGHPYHNPDTPDGKRNAQLKAVFDVFVSSAHVGMRKPDEDIYHYAFAKVSEIALNRGFQDLRKEDVTFLDDIGANLKTAKKEGWNTIKVDLGRTDKAVAELERRTGLVLSGDKARL